MKQYTYLISLLFVIALTLTSCDDKKTYAELLKDERVIIDNFIKKNKIKVVSEFPTANNWADSIYVKTNSGLYFRLINKGEDSESAATVEPNDLIAVRYIQYILTGNQDSVSRWNTIDSPYPEKFNLGDYSQACAAWHEAVSYMKYNESEAFIIVPSKIGFQSNMISVTPLRYKIKIQFQK